MVEEGPGSGRPGKERLCPGHNVHPQLDHGFLPSQCCRPRWARGTRNLSLLPCWERAQASRSHPPFTCGTRPVLWEEGSRETSVWEVVRAGLRLECGQRDGKCQAVILGDRSKMWPGLGVELKVWAFVCVCTLMCERMWWEARMVLRCLWVL